MPRTDRSLTLEEVRALYAPAAGPTGALPAEVEVAIVGGGPVGLTLAAALGHAGIVTVLVEQNAATADAPRAIMIDDEYMRLLDRIGLMADIAPHLTAPVGIHFVSPLGFALARVPGLVTPNGFGGRCAMAQPVFEKLLLESLARFPTVTIRFGTRLVALRQDAETVMLDVAQDDGTRTCITARYLLACDGAHSMVRKELGIAFDGRHVDEPHLVVDLADFPDHAGHMTFILRPSRPVNIIPAPYGGKRMEFMLKPGDDPAKITSPASIRRLVDTATPFAGAPLHIIRAATYGFAERVAGRLREGRVFLLGDAAHIMPPFGGQGLNTGAKDVSNLAWKVAMVLRGGISPAALDSYEAERRTIIADIVAFAGRVGRITNIRSRPLALLRDGAFAVANLFPGVRRYFNEMRYVPRPVYRTGLFLHRPGEDSMTGRLFPRPQLVTSAGVAAHYDALAGDGFSLAGIAVAPGVLEKAAAHPLWRRLGASAIAIGWDGALQAAPAGVTMARLADPAAPHPVKAAAGRIVVVRPDRYVAALVPPEEFVAASDRLAVALGVAVKVPADR